MDMIKAELAALVAVYDEHESRWPQADVDALYQAVEHARAVLAQPGPAAAADGEVGDLVLAMKELAYDVAPYTCDLLNRAADLLELERQPLRPIPVAERLPGPEDCLPWPGEPDETPWCWAFVKGPLDDDSWERRPVTCLATYKSMHTHWLPAHALPLPEFDHE